MSRGPLGRCVQMYARLLRGEHCNATTLAAVLEFDAKTVLRDLDFLRDSLWLQRPGDVEFKRERPERGRGANGAGLEAFRVLGPGWVRLGRSRGGGHRHAATGRGA